MCPDETLLTSYVDGEVPSPWKERLELHLAHCSRCAKRTEAYRALSAALRKDIPIDQAQLDYSLERVRTALAEKRRNLPAGMPLWSARWHGVFALLTARKVVLPLPVFIASMLLMVFFAGLAFGIFGASRRVSQALALSARLPASSTASIESFVSSIAQTAPAELVTINAPGTVLNPATGTSPVFVIYHSGNQKPTIMEVPVYPAQGASR